MKRSVAPITCAVVLCATAPSFMAWGQDPPNPQAVPDNPEPIVPLEKGQPEFRAGNLSVEADCSPIYAGEHSTVFRWSPASRGERSRLDATRYYAGFEAGRFETLATVSQSTNRFEWSEGEPAAAYRWRVLTLVEGKWYASETAYYVVPVCVSDEEGRDGEDPDGAGNR